MASNKTVFYCRECIVATVSDGPVQCEKCNKVMTEIGWFQSDASSKEAKEQKD